MPSKNSTTFSVRISNELLEYLDQAAELMQVSRTRVICQALGYLLTDDALTVSDKDTRSLPRVLGIDPDTFPQK